MASPTTPTVPPTPPPPVTYRPRRSFACPVLLIVLGVLFLLGNLGFLSWGRLGYLFARYWPVLIILWGLIKLAEHFEAQRHGYRTRGLGFGGVMFLIFLVVMGLCASSAWHYRGVIGDEFSQIGDEPAFTFFGTPYNYTDELQQPFPAGASLRVVSDRGEVHLISWDQNTIKVGVQKKVIAESQSDADKVNAATRPTITVVGDQVTVNANTASGNHRVETNLEIYLPRKAAADIATAHGKVEVHDRTGDLKISNSHGDVELGGIQGNVSINMRGGSLRAEDVRGDLSLDGRLSDVAIENVQGSVRLTGDYFGTTRLAKITNTVHFLSSRTDMEMAKLDGDLVLDSGDLRVSSLAGPTRVVTRSKDIRLDDFTGNLHIEDNNSDIELTPGKLPLGNIQIANRRGRIHLVLPANAAFQLEAHTTQGDISSDFSGVNVESHARGAQATGAIGGGGPQIQLSTDRGDIEIRKG
ncbi:MAG: DUF4097 family beta strand repeat-containing protein [Terriglobales bacterium]